MKPSSSFAKCRVDGRLATALLLAAFLIPEVRSADVTWSPTPSDALWSDGLNWSTSPTPPTAGDALFFESSSLTALSNGFPVNTLFNGLTFNAGASPFSITGNAITLGGNVTNNSTSVQHLGLDILLGAAARTFTTTGGGGNLVVSGIVSGAAPATLTKQGVGTLTLTGANTYTSNTAVNNGSIIYGSSILPSRVQSFSGLFANAGADASIVSVLGNSGNASLSFSGATANDGSALNFVVSGGVNGATNQIRVPGSGFLRSRIFFNGADYAFVDVGGFVRAPVYGVDVSFFVAPGVLVAGHNLVTASITAQAAVTVNTIKFDGTSAVDLDLAGPLTIGTGFGASAGGLIRSGGGSTTISGGSITFSPGTLYNIRTDTASDRLTINSGFVASSVNPLVKSGAGMLVLGGNNTYAGITHVDNGTLVVNGTHLAPTGLGYVVYAGATLGGSGTIGIAQPNTVTINSGAVLSPGDLSQILPENQTGTLDLQQALLLSAGSLLEMQLGGAEPGDGAGFYDQINLMSPGAPLILQSGVSLSLSLVNTYDPADGSAFYLLTRLDEVANTEFFTGLPEGASFLLGGKTFFITYEAKWDGSQLTSALTGGNDIAVYLQPVPEPSALALLAIGAAVTLLRLRRRV
jgi:autotransporter-associated beta strand protein